MWSTYWWVIDDINSENDGEEFFTELTNATIDDHRDYVESIFPDTYIKCLGRVSQEQAEAMGLDTY